MYLIILLGGGQNIDYSELPFGIKALSGITNIKWISDIVDNNTLYYKINDGNWTNYTIGNNITIAKDQICYFSGTNNYFNRGDEEDKYLSASNYIEVIGNLLSLVNSDNDFDAIFSFNSLFFNNRQLKEANNLILPNKIGENTYSYMFSHCSSLRTVPALPASTLTLYCYQGMFKGCTSLSSVPTNLLTAEIMDSCYFQMFDGCTSLTAAPILPATEVYPWSYMQMFYGCSKLSSIEVNFTDWGEETDATYYWVYNVASTGQFICPAALPHTSQYFDVSHIPPGWTVITK